MSNFGVTPQGFVQKDLQDILDEVEQEERSAFGPAINTQADSVLGQINGILGDKIAELWEVLLSVYRARQPDSAGGEALDNVGAITGAVRLPALESAVVGLLNLDAGASLPLGSVASIGAAGARWVTQASVTNPEAFAATVSVILNSEDAAPVVGNAYAIDTIAVPSAGWSAAAAKNTLNSEPFALKDKQTLLVEVDEGAQQTVVFDTADFADITNATALEVADALSAALLGASAIDAGGQVRLSSGLEGTGSSLLIKGGTASEALGFTREKFRGFNPSVAAKILSGNTELYVLADGQTLFIKIDRGATQIITFEDAQFAEPAAGLLEVLAASSYAAGVDTDTFVLDDGVNPPVTFVFDDDGSVVESATLRAINHTGGEDEATMNALVVDAINTAPTLDITATDEGVVASKGQTSLVNDNPGTAGNIAIVETVANAGFVATGMAGGLATTIAAATAIQVAKAINEQLVDGAAYEALGKVQVESLVPGTNSFVEVTGGTANAALGFPEGAEQGGISGDALVGRDVESDADYRLRREELLRITGAATVEAIRSAVRAIENPDVVQAFVFENTSDIVDGFGRPPHSFEVVVVGGDDQEIANVIFSVKPVGIQTFRVAGANGRTKTVVDSQGVSHTIEYSRADDIRMYTIIDVEVDDAAAFGGGVQTAGEQQIREAIKALGDLQQIGQDVVILKYACAALEVAGVFDTTSIKIEDIPVPVNEANIPIGDRELATFATGDITVNVVFV